jgi:hypothetical protein
MHCLLQVASNGIFDFSTEAGGSCTLFVENTAFGEGDQIRLLEDCGGAQTHDGFLHDGDPVAIYRAYAT